MSSLSPELKEFLTTVAKVAASVAESSEPVSAGYGMLHDTGLLDMAREIADEPDSLVWLTNAISVTAQSSPSLAFALAGRYTADHAIGPDTDATNPTFALAIPGSVPVVSGSLEPDTVAVLDTSDNVLRSAPWTDTAPTATEPRTGLAQAELVSVTLPADAAPCGREAVDVLARWDLLTGAALVGLARRAVRETQTYVMERHQFGVPIGSFAGLRALTAEMEIKVDEVEAMLDHAVAQGEHSASVSAAAGRAAIAVCVDAIQAHGGYGYVDEYAITGLLRDAISIQARAGGRRLHIARVAERGLGPQGGSPP
ncbi:MAG: acyl-CoA dehydrogenase [Rhodococcus sp. (in: high G+C Gram-positive bacteria)]|nr:MAG: acyl-CoA dehydrogenase [Rhodococcus sp. (in: high G+C Gram-positive bacteria)]